MNNAAAPRSPYYIGIEIGGTKQQIAVGAGDGAIVERRQVKLGAGTTAAGILDWIRNTTEQLRRTWEISGIGVGFGGPLDAATGAVVCSLQVDGWKDFPLRDWFAQTFALPVTVLNDTLTGGFGELHRGAGVGAGRFFYTNIGTGIGGGLYLPGSFNASSLGYVWVPDWTAAEAGAKTRLEYLCAGPFIEKHLNTPGRVPPSSFLTECPMPYTCGDLAEGARRGDPFCSAELDRVASSFALGLADALALTSVERVVIGGGVAKMGDVLFSRIRRFTEEYAFVADIGRYEILPGTLQDDAVLIGALLLAGELAPQLRPIP